MRGIWNCRGKWECRTVRSIELLVGAVLLMGAVAAEVEAAALAQREGGRPAALGAVGTD